MLCWTLNVTDGVDVTRRRTWRNRMSAVCDYQLQTRDMWVALEGADALVINGGGMEQFMDG